MRLKSPLLLAPCLGVLGVCLPGAAHAERGLYAVPGASPAAQATQRPPGAAPAPYAAPTPADPDTQRRLDYLTATLTTSAPEERLWHYGWSLGFAALTIGQAYFFFRLDDPAERVLNGVGGTMSTLGLISLWVLPNAGLHADRALAQEDTSTRSGRARALNTAEELLQGSAEATWMKRSPLAVVLPYLVSVSSATYVMVRYEAWWPAIRTLTGAAAVNLTHFVTRPTGNLDAARRYRGESASLSLTPAPLIAEGSYGVGVLGQF